MKNGEKIKYFPCSIQTERYNGFRRNIFISAVYFPFAYNLASMVVMNVHVAFVKKKIDNTNTFIQQKRKWNSRWNVLLAYREFVLI